VVKEDAIKKDLNDVKEDNVSAVQEAPVAVA
jgi:hypothetical protein